jgi:hypothetical protein
MVIKIYMGRNLYQFLITILENSSSILLASIFLLFGIFLGKLVEIYTKKFLMKVRLNVLVKNTIIYDFFREKLQLELDSSHIISQIFKWFVIFLSFMVISEILSLEKLSQFFLNILDYFPNIFISVLIFIIFAFLSDFARRIFIGSVEKGKITYSGFGGKVLSNLIFILGILAILYQLKIVPELILVVFIGLVAIFVLIVGISFGLAGKDFASKILKEIEEKLK